MTLLLDTHVFVWWIAGEGRFSAEQRDRLSAIDSASPARVSDISLWEIANLVSLGRVELNLPLAEWLRHATAPPLVERVGISPAIAATVADLPDSFHRDPADRIIVATAKVLGAMLVTSDRRVRASGLVPTL